MVQKAVHRAGTQSKEQDIVSVIKAAQPDESDKLAKQKVLNLDLIPRRRLRYCVLIKRLLWFDATLRNG